MPSLLGSASIRLPFGRFGSESHSRYCRLRQDSNRRSTSHVHHPSLNIDIQRIFV